MRDALRAKVKDIVDADQPFDATDVVMHGAHFNRFAFAWQNRDRIVIATEHGGIAYWNAIYLVVPQDIGAHSGPLHSQPVQLAEAAHAQPGTLCSSILRALSEPRGRQPGTTPPPGKRP